MFEVSAAPENHKRLSNLPSASFAPGLPSKIEGAKPTAAPRRPSGQEIQAPERHDSLKTKAIFSLHEVLTKQRQPEGNDLPLAKPVQMSQTVQFGEINLEISINEVRKS